MLDELTIRPYAPDDESALVALWNETMWADPIDCVIWRTRYLLDPNFSPDECLVAVDSNSRSLAGFVFGISAKAGDSRSIQPPDAWVVAFGVDADYRRNGVGRALLNRLESRWIHAGVTRAAVGPYVPSYLTPGIDEHAYPDAVPFLRDWGAETGSRPLSMKASLTGFRPRSGATSRREALDVAGIRIRPASPADIVPLLSFLDIRFPHWRPDATSVLADLNGSYSRTVTMHIAENTQGIVGYAQSRGERFGPFGVDESLRGRGIGAELLDATLMAMRTQGFHCAWFLWTSDRAANLYRTHGFEEVRRFSLMTKVLKP
jgi:GNAT superfamily N-acetyltransferase